jgi:dienelactone hydrolase
MLQRSNVDRAYGSALAMLSALFLPPVTSAAAQATLTYPSLDADLAGGKATPVSAWLYRPAGAGPFPAVVAPHGCGGLVERTGKSRGALTARHADWAKRLSTAGYVVLLPDSFGSRGIAEICTVKERDAIQRARPRDAYGALVWLQAQPFIQPDRIAVLGWSNGGGTVIRSVEAKSEARPESLPHGDFRAAVAFYPGCPDPKRSKTGREWRPSAPLLILVGEADDWTPATPCRNLAEAAGKRGDDVTLQLYPGAYHGFDTPNPGVRVRTGLATARDGTAHVGNDPAARADSLVRVPEFLRRHLGG